MDNKFSEILKAFSAGIADGTVQDYDDDDITYHLEKTNGQIKITINSKKKFDDTETKELIKEYQDKIKDVDNATFIDAMKELSKEIDLKSFDEMMKLEHLTEEQANEIEDNIDIATSIICRHLQKKIQNMVTLFDRF